MTTKITSPLVLPPPPLQALTPCLIRQAIENVCQRINAEQERWFFRSANESDLNLEPQINSSDKSKDKNEDGVGDRTIMSGGQNHQEREVEARGRLLYGLVVVANTPSTSSSSSFVLTTFYMAYSTWNGRVLQLDTRRIAGVNNGDVDLLDLLIRRCLARLAVQLNCARLVWQEYYDDSITTRVPQKKSHGGGSVVAAMAPPPPPPEHLKDWLTLQWDDSDMKRFLEKSSGGIIGIGIISPSSTTTTGTTTRDIITQAVHNLNDTADPTPFCSSNFVLRLASCFSADNDNNNNDSSHNNSNNNNEEDGDDDVRSIARLVQGLADFEKERDAVKVSREQFKIDGFDCQPPLYYCILIDAVHKEHHANSAVSASTSATSTTSTTEVSYYTCGMALCTLEENLESGKQFIYLEDLFFEEPYRGSGGGTLVMKTLATVALSLGCGKMMWQALDWNAPALAFYGKLGARVLEGLETWRYSGTSLAEFAEDTSPLVPPFPRPLPPLQALTPCLIRQAIENVCQRINTEQERWFFRSANESDLNLQAHISCNAMSKEKNEDGVRGSTMMSREQNHQEREVEPRGRLLYGLIVVANTPSASSSSSFVLTTFYMAYSTWNGRALHLDTRRIADVNNGDAGPYSVNDTDEKSLGLLDPLIHRCLARIAVQLNCVRFVWQEYYDDSTTRVPQKNSNGGGSVVAAVAPPQAEHLKGWLTLHWDDFDMKSFLEKSSVDIINIDIISPQSSSRGGGGGGEGFCRPSSSTSTSASARDIITQALQNVNATANPTPSCSSSFVFRLASCSSADNGSGSNNDNNEDVGEDVRSMARLVQGLADFAKEPDAIKVTREQYKMDGFDCQPPLYYCILIDAVHNAAAAAITTTSAASTTSTTENSYYTCGIAVYTLEENLESGKQFIYLEDLFFEEPYRGRGGGTLAMKALATVALSLGCGKMAWHSLDWNAPALAFYGKLGARVIEGLETLRYSGTSLVEFAEGTASY